MLCQNKKPVKTTSLLSTIDKVASLSILSITIYRIATNPEVVKTTKIYDSGICGGGDCDAAGCDFAVSAGGAADCAV